MYELVTLLSPIYTIESFCAELSYILIIRVKRSKPFSLAS